MNPLYNGHTSTASIGWGVFISTSWGADYRFHRRTFIGTSIGSGTPQTLIVQTGKAR
jgi:hypothetical protein